MDGKGPRGHLARWRFGTVEVDESVATVRRGEELVSLDRSSYDVLRALLRNEGEVVTKDELLEAGWPGRVVSENSLAKAISRLRAALGEEAATLRVVHGYGYRLATTVAIEAVPPGVDPVAPPTLAHLHPGDEVPQRPGWRLLRRIGEGASGIIWLARSDAGESRALKFADSLEGVRCLKREIALARYLASVGDAGAGIVPVLGWNLSHAPFFLELPWMEAGNLHDWARDRGGLAAIPRTDRIDLCVQLCEAVAILHKVGVIHRDLKPENIYPVRDPSAPGGWRMLLADLGAGDTTSSPQLAALGITMSVLDSVTGEGASRYPGSLLYIAPEVVAGEAPTQRSDVFALGVLLFQLAVADLRRTLAPGWESDVEDPLLCEDIRLAAAANPARRVVDAHGLADRLRSLEARKERREAEERQHAALARQARELDRLRRRRKWLAAGTAVLVGVLSLSLWQQHRVGRAHALARAAAADANAQSEISEAVVEFLTRDVLKQGDPYARSEAPETMRDVLDRAAGTVEQRFAGQPNVAAAIHGTLGGAYEGLNDFARAVSHFERQVSMLRGVRPRDADAIADASARWCAAWNWEGTLAQPWASCRQARADFVAAGREPALPEVFLSLADSREGRYRDALARLESWMPAIQHSNDAELRGFALSFAAIYTSRLGELERHERMTRELLALHESGGDGMDLAWALTYHGNALLLLGREGTGLDHLARARAMFEKVGGNGHPHAGAPRVRLAAHFLRTGQWEKVLAEARPNYESLLDRTGWQNWTIYAALQTMEAEARLGHRDAATRVMADFQAMAGNGMDQEFPYLREPHWLGMARTWIALGDAARAEQFIGRLEALAGEPDGNPLLRGDIACLRGELARLRRDAATARARAEQCRELIAAIAPADSALLSWPDRLARSVAPSRPGTVAAP